MKSLIAILLMAIFMAYTLYDILNVCSCNDFNFTQNKKIYTLYSSSCPYGTHIFVEEVLDYSCACYDYVDKCGIEFRRAIKYL